MPLRTQAAEVAWLNTRLTLDFIAASRLWIDDDLVSALLVAGVLDANVGGGDNLRIADPAYLQAGVVPDTMRRPVNAMSVALSLGVPRESARIKLAALVDRGVLRRNSLGFILSADVAQSKPFKAAMGNFVHAVAEFINGLAALRACGVHDGDHIAAPAWSVAGVSTRLATAHVLRGIDLARSLKPEISLTTHYVMLALSHLTGSALRVVQGRSVQIEFAHCKPSLGPVSVSDLARFLKMDDETVRRHVGQLEACAAVVRVGAKRDINLNDPALVARWLAFQSRTLIGTHLLVRKLYVAGVIVDAPSAALRVY